MAIVKDLIVLGSTRQIGPAYAGTIYAESFVKNGSDSSHVLLGDGSDLALSSLNSSHTHYVGTTQVQNSSAAQGLTGITSIASPASTALYISPASTLYLDSAASTSILFRKGTTEMARFNTSSNLCIGTTSPNDNTTYKLDVGGKGRFSNQIVSSLANGTAPFVVSSSTLVNKLNADMLDGKHADYFAPYEQTFGTVGHFENGISNSNHIARGDLGLVGFDNTGVRVDIYEAAPGLEYDSTPLKTITTTDTTYGDAFKKGLSSMELHRTHAGDSLKIVIRVNYVKAVGLFISTGGHGMSYKSTVGNTTNSGEFSTYGSWFIFTVNMASTNGSAEIQLNTSNEDYELVLSGIRTYVTNPSHYRFPGIANTADSATISQYLSGGAKGSIPYQTAASVTGMLAIGSTGQVLAVNGSGSSRLPAWKNINDIHNHDDQYLQLSGGIITGDLTVDGITKFGDTKIGGLTVDGNTVAYSDILLWADSGNSPSLIFNRAGSSLTDWKLQVKSGNLYFSSATNGSSFTDRAYFKDGTKQLYADLLGNAYSATNLVSAPNLDIYDDTHIIVTAGNQTSEPFVVHHAKEAETAEISDKVMIENNSTSGLSYNILFHYNYDHALYSTSDIQVIPSTGEVTAKHFTVTHVAGGQNEYRLKYSTTVDMAMMIGSGNANHGLYDIKNSKWMIVADQSGNVTVNGNATSATTATTATKLSTVSKTAWGQTFWTSGGVPTSISGNMTSVGSISASGNIITEKSDTTAVRVSAKNSNGEIAIYTSANRGVYDFTSGKWLIAYNSASTYTFLGVGNVGVGCEPTVKLDVNGQIKSRSATGTAPFVVSSTTKVNNLNADFLDGEHSYNLRSIPDNGGDVLFSIFPYIDSRINPFNKVVDIDVAPGDAPFGYCFGPIVNYSTFVSTYISVTPGDKIRGEVYAYRDSEATATNNGVLYCGISRYDRNKKPITSNSGNQYFVASNSTVPSDGVWHKYSGTVTIPTEHTIYNGSDGGGVYYVKIILYVDYNKNDCIPTYIGGLQFTKLLDNNYTDYLPLAGGTMTGAISRNYTAASSVPVLNVASSNQDIWLWRVRSADSGTSSSVDKVYGFGAKYLGTGTGNNNSWAMYADNQNDTQIKALEMKQSGDLFAYAPIHWANSTALPEDTSPQYILTIDSFANGGKTKWTSKANLATSIGLGNYLPLSGGTITGNLSVNDNLSVNNDLTVSGMTNLSTLMVNVDTILGSALSNAMLINYKRIGFNDNTSIEFDNLGALWGTL